MRHGDHDISLLVPSLDVLEGFGYSLQGETSIDNRLELAGRDKVGDEAHSCRVLHGHAAFQFLAAGYGRPQDPNHASEPHNVLKKNTVGFQDVATPTKTGRADDVKYQVVGIGLCGEIYLRVFISSICATYLHHV